jgi:oligopeptide/dipeptide ABC transporter ATP-binding protein
MTNVTDTLIEIKGLKTHFFTSEGVVKAVDGVDMTIKRNRTMCVVGESGCGKSVTAFSILQLVTRPGRVVEGSMLYYSQREGGADVIDLAKLHPRGREILKIRGRDISMIFQEPMTSLSPVHTIGDQLSEAVLQHMKVSKSEASDRVVEMLRRVGIPKPSERLLTYPFQLSGGMRQRVMIAMALSCNPSLLIADEPTTALDVTTQATILDLISELQAEFGMAVMFITHNLGVVAEIAEDVAVMYLGKVVEYGNVDDIFHNPKHPYASALLKSIPLLGSSTRQFLQGESHIERMATIRGMIPHPFARPNGCVFHPRCDHFMRGVCDVDVPPNVEIALGHNARCWLYAEHAPEKKMSV